MNIFYTRLFGLMTCCFFLAFSPRTSAQNDPICFQLLFPTVQAQVGDTVCVPLMVRDFELIVAMQFATKWDTASLELLDLDYYVDSDLPGIEPWHFFLNEIGKLSFSWDDVTGMGVTLPDSSDLFTLCFRVKNGATGFSSVYVDPLSMPKYEVVQILPPDWHPVRMPYAQQIGGVLVGNNTPSNLTLESICATSAICSLASGSASITMSGGAPPYTYVWSGPDGFSDTAAILLTVPGGTYRVTVTDQNGSTLSAETLVNSSPLNISAGIQTTQAFCGQPTGCATLTVHGSNPPFAFQWDSGNSQSAENCALLPGQHTVTISDQLGCEKVVPFQVLNNDAFNLGFTYQHIYECQGTGYISALVFQPENYQFLWSNGDTTFTADSLSAGVYSVTVTSAGGCTRTGSIEILDKSTQYWHLGLLPLCPTDGALNGNLLLAFNNLWSGILFPATVAWSDGTTRLIAEEPMGMELLDTLAEVPSGLYHVTVTDADGCEASLSKVLYCEPLPTVPNGFPAIYVEDDFITPQYATDSCAGIYGRNVEDMKGLAFSLRWSAYYGEFKGIKNLNLPGLSLNDFTILQDEGTLGVNWSSSNPISLPNESLLFEVCFTAEHNINSINLDFYDAPVSPKNVDAMDQEQPFIGRSGNLLFGPYFPPGPSVCDFAALPLSCDFDGKARIALGTCDPDKFLTGSCSRKDSAGIYRNYGDLSSLLFAEEGTYIIYAGQAASSYNHLLAHIPAAPSLPECVWPGDADNNNAVNHHDLLYIGLAYGSAGALRDGASSLWLGQDCEDWVQNTSVRHVNYKNIDGNGDGEINAADTLAIVQNWGRVINPAKDNPFGLPQGNPAGSQHPMLALQSDTLEAGQSVSLPLSLGTSDMPMDNVYGLAFSISYDPALVNDKVSFKPSSSWFGDSTEYIFLQKNFPQQGHLDVAITRTDGIPVSGWGPIGNVLIIIEDNIFGGPSPLNPDTTVKTNLFFSGLHSVTANESAQGLGANPTELVIRRSTSGIKILPDWAQYISISPNPAAETLLISSKETNMVRIEISSVSGMVLQQLSLEADEVQLPVGALPNGTYFVRIFTEKGVTIKPLQIAH